MSASTSLELTDLKPSDAIASDDVRIETQESNAASKSEGCFERLIRKFEASWALQKEKKIVKRLLLFYEILQFVINTALVVYFFLTIQSDLSQVSSLKGSIDDASQQRDAMSASLNVMQQNMTSAVSSMSQQLAQVSEVTLQVSVLEAQSQTLSNSTLQLSQEIQREVNLTTELLTFAPKLLAVTYGGPTQYSDYPGVSYNTQLGYYKQVGNLVTYSFIVGGNIGASSSSNTFIALTLPVGTYTPAVPLNGNIWVPYQFGIAGETQFGGSLVSTWLLVRAYARCSYLHWYYPGTDNLFMNPSTGTFNLQGTITYYVNS